MARVGHRFLFPSDKKLPLNNCKLTIFSRKKTRTEFSRAKHIQLQMVILSIERQRHVVVETHHSCHGAIMTPFLTL